MILDRIAVYNGYDSWELFKSKRVVPFNLPMYIRTDMFESVLQQIKSTDMKLVYKKRTDSLVLMKAK